jgi:hypothetical protein
VPIQFISPLAGSDVPSQFPVVIGYSGVGNNCTLTCTIEGVTRETVVSGSGSWQTPDFNPTPGLQMIDASSSVGDLISEEVNVT